MSNSVDGSAPVRRTGRRSGESGTRDAILAAARSQFAEKGYAGASLRAIAAEAGVDAALIRHFFGSKDDLFAATLDVPHHLVRHIKSALVGEPSGLGVRLARAYLELWEDPETAAPVLSLIRTAAGSEKAAARLRDAVAEQLLGDVSRMLPLPDAPVRAALVGSQLVGLVMTRHILRLDPIATLDLDTLVDLCAPTLQRYLTGPFEVHAPNPEALRPSP